MLYNNNFLENLVDVIKNTEKYFPRKPSDVTRLPNSRFNCRRHKMPSNLFVPEETCL